MGPSRSLLVVGVCMCLSVLVSANIVTTSNMFKYKPTNQANAVLTVTGGSQFGGSSTSLPQNTVTGLPQTTDWGPQQNTTTDWGLQQNTTTNWGLQQNITTNWGLQQNATTDALPNTAWDAQQNSLFDNSSSNQGKLVIVDTNNTTPQDITAVNAGGGDIVLTMETVPTATPSPPAQSKTNNWNWIVTRAPKATPSPTSKKSNWNWIVTQAPRATPSPPARGRGTNWNWIVTPTPRATPSRRTTEWNWIVTPRATPSPPTRKSNWNWIVTPAPTTPAPITPAPYTSVPNYQHVTIGPTPYYYGHTNTAGYFGMGNTAGYYGTPPQWQVAYQHHPQQTTPFPGNKYGECPLPSVVGKKCGYRCKQDSECGADWKCCHDGSGRQDGCCHARKQTEFESFMNSMWDMPPSQEIQNEMP